MLPEALGYDRATIIFSPDGRLIQVEYAKEAASSGTPVIGVIYKDGVILMAIKKNPYGKLLILESVQKIYKIESNIGCGITGYLSDGRVLVNVAREMALNHKAIYGEKISIEKLVKDLGDYMQVFTQYGGLRPFGVAMLLASYEDKPYLYLLEPSGMYFSFRAIAIGKNADKANKVLEEGFKEGMNLREAIKLAIKALKEAIKGEEIKKNEIELVVIDKEGFRPEDIAKYW